MMRRYRGLLAALVIVFSQLFAFHSTVKAQTSVKETLFKLCEVERQISRVAMGARKSGLTRDQAVDELLNFARDKNSYYVSEMIGTWIKLYNIVYMEKYIQDPDQYANNRYRKCIEKYM